MNFIKFFYIKDWRSYIAEFLGTFAFVFIASGVVVGDLYFGNIGKIGIATTIGFAYAALVFSTVHLSGGYLNPSITLALWLTQKLSGTKTIFFILVQILASLSAAAVLLLIFGQEAKQVNLGAPILGVGTIIQAAVLVETILTAILIFAVFATMIDRAGPVSFGPLVLGLVLTAETLFAFPLTGAAFNQVRVLGPAIISATFENLAVWIIAPLAGSLFGLVYDFLFLKKPSKKS